MRTSLASPKSTTSSTSFMAASARHPPTHNVIKIESQDVMEKTVRFFRDSMSNRLNDEDSAIVVCMQRVHDTDVSGDILAREADYCHLMIPMLQRGVLTISASSSSPPSPRGDNDVRISGLGTENSDHRLCWLLSQPHHRPRRRTCKSPSR
jgi:hypothetical protein